MNCHLLLWKPFCLAKKTHVSVDDKNDEALVAKLDNATDGKNIVFLKQNNIEMQNKLLWKLKKKHVRFHDIFRSYQKTFCH